MADFERRGEGTLLVRIDPRLYPEPVVYKAFYWYGADYDVVIALRDDGRFEVSITLKEGELSEAREEQLRSRVLQDLVDFKTRHLVTEETAAVRALLVAKAFASGDDFDEPPPGDVSDPVGFEPGAFAVGTPRITELEG